jgi:outer membrane protein assembly factor BamB
VILNDLYRMDQNQKIKITLNTAYISGIFTVIVALVLLLNYVQITTNKPLESKSMELLIRRMKAEPNNEELKQEIRNLDLMARKAFFTNQWQINTGRYLLLFGGILFIVSLRYYYSLIFKKEKPKKQSSDEERKMIVSLRLIAIAGGLLFLVAFLSSFAVMDHLRMYRAEDSGAGLVQESQEDIKVIDISEGTGEVKTVDTSVTRGEQDTESLTEGMEKTSQDLQTIPEQSKVISAPGFPSMAEIRANYNSFRGPLGQGVSGARNVPVDWDGATGKNILWKIQLSKPGNNSPVIWKDKLYIAGADAQVRMIYCIDRNTGNILWQKEVKDIPGSPAAIPKTTEDAGLSAPTVTTDGARVYVIYANGDIAAFTGSGNLVWGRNLGLPDNHYGYASSPVVWNNKVFIQFDSNKGGRVMALNCKTGETVWDTKRNVKISWASPILAEINGKIQLVLSADPLVAGYDTESGTELWSIGCIMGEVGSSPAFWDGLVYAANEYARLVAVKPGPSPSVVWENDEYLPEVPSPVVSDGLLFLATTYGVLVCYDAKTGEKYWEREFKNGFFSSPVIADQKLYATDLSGKMHIFRVSKTAELIGEPVLGERISTTPAFSDGRIYLRGENSLYCIGQKLN